MISGMNVVFTCLCLISKLTEGHEVDDQSKHVDPGLRRGMTLCKFKNQLVQRMF
ncbi:hypothetical protein AAZX31_16G149000 [Glycine max]